MCSSNLSVGVVTCICMRCCNLICLGNPRSIHGCTSAYYIYLNLKYLRGLHPVLHLPGETLPNEINEELVLAVQVVLELLRAWDLHLPA